MPTWGQQPGRSVRRADLSATRAAVASAQGLHASQPLGERASRRDRVATIVYTDDHAVETARGKTPAVAAGPEAKPVRGGEAGGDHRDVCREIGARRFRPDHWRAAAPRQGPRSTGDGAAGVGESQ